MKMKNILYCTVLIAMASLMTGCSLDETPKSSFSEEKAYSTPDLVYLNTVANLYNKLHSRFHGGDDNYSYMSELTADILFRPGRQGDWVDGGKHQNAFLHKWDKSTDYLKNLWNDSYSDIALCNAALAKLIEIRDSLKTIPAENINPMIAEVRGIRAFYYMWLVDFYGRIPLVTSPGVGIGDVKQEDRKTAYEFVKKELCEILPVLPDKPSQTKGDYYSRITRPVVYAMIARFAINGAVFTQNEWYNGQFTGGIDKVENSVTEAGMADFWEIPGVKDPMNAWETVIYCQEILGGSYSLEVDFASNFKIGNESSCENIFVEPMDDDVYRIGDSQISLSINYQHASALGFNSSNGTCATTHAIKVFGYVEKYETEKKGSDEAVPGAFEKESGIFTTDPYDYRFDVSFFYGPCKVQDSIRVKSGVSAEKWPYGCYLGYAARNDYSAEDYSSDWGKYVVKWGGLRIKKYEYDPTTSEASIFNADRVIYRYGDMLLLAAEAQYRLGNSINALSLLNEVHSRSMPLYPLDSINLQVILDEKLKEEIWETMGRRGDLIRCGLYTEPDEDKYEGVKHAPAASNWEYDATGYTCVFPIPADVISLNKNLTQNKGY